MRHRIQVRKAKPEEHEDIFLMGYDAWGANLPEEIYLESCLASYKYKQGQFYVLEDEEYGLLSSCIVYPLSMFGGVIGENAVGIGNLATIPSNRHQGYASLCLSLLIQQLEFEGVDAFFIHSDIHPKIYERLGFVAAPKDYHTDAGCTPMLKLSGKRQLIPEHWDAFVLPQFF